MSRPPPDHRAGIEEIYSRQAHDRDAAENARPKAALHHGVRVEADPDRPGSFRLRRASMQAGEAEHAEDAIFLFPVRVTGAQPTTGYSAPGGGADARPETGADAYAEFIDRVLEAARNARFLDPIGRDEERLRGPHGG